MNVTTYGVDYLLTRRGVGVDFLSPTENVYILRGKRQREEREEELISKRSRQGRVMP